MSYFPMFIELEGMPCLIVGGGRIALRKAEVLRDFGAEIFVVSPVVSPEILIMEHTVCLQREFRREDVKGKTLVIAASGDRDENSRISRICKEEGIPVNAVDQTEDCSFIFPAYIKEGEVTAAFSSGGQSPVLAQYLKAKAEPFVTPQIGRAAELLGGIRETVRSIVKTEDGRKQVYRELLQVMLEREESFSENEVFSMLEKYRDRG